MLDGIGKRSRRPPLKVRDTAGIRDTTEFSRKRKRTEVEDNITRMGSDENDSVDAAPDREQTPSLSDLDLQDPHASPNARALASSRNVSRPAVLVDIVESGEYVPDAADPAVSGNEDLRQTILEKLRRRYMFDQPLSLQDAQSPATVGDKATLQQRLDETTAERTKLAREKQLLLQRQESIAVEDVALLEVERDLRTKIEGEEKKEKKESALEAVMAALEQLEEASR